HPVDRVVLADTHVVQRYLAAGTLVGVGGHGDQVGRRVHGQVHADPIVDVGDVVPGLGDDGARRIQPTRRVCIIQIIILIDDKCFADLLAVTDGVIQPRIGVAVLHQPKAVAEVGADGQPLGVGDVEGQDVAEVAAQLGAVDHDVERARVLAGGDGDLPGGHG